MSPLLAQSGHSLRCNAMSAFGGKADMPQGAERAVKAAAMRASADRQSLRKPLTQPNNRQGVPLPALRSRYAASIKLRGGLVRGQSGKLGQDRAQFLGALFGLIAIGD